MPLQHSPAKMMPGQPQQSTAAPTMAPLDSTRIHDQTTQSNLDEPFTPLRISTEVVSNCKLPPFWRHCPDLWFIKIEHQLQNHRITSDNSKYTHLVTALDADTMQEVSDILRNPPTADRYDNLKQALLTRLTDSADRQLHKALTEIQLGDMKPSQLLRQMKTLTQDRASEDVLRVRWLALLPTHSALSKDDARGNAGRTGSSSGRAN